MNAFAGIDINLPEAFKEKLQTYCQSGQKGVSNLEENPFPRMIDMWFLAVCLAAKKDLKHEMRAKGAQYKAMEGVVLGSDSWRSNALVLLAISHTEDIAVADNPREMMRIANGYALAGLSYLIDLIESRDGDTPLNFCVMR